MNGPIWSDVNLDVMAIDKQKITAKRFLYFTSTVDVNIDPTTKRIVIPNFYVRQGLTKECYLVEQSTGHYDFVTVMTPAKFEEYAKHYLERGELGEVAYRDRKRAFFSRVKHQKLSDSKPRITLDLEMLEHLRLVDLSTPLVFVGVGDTVELWRRDKYNSWRDSEGARVG